MQYHSGTARMNHSTGSPTSPTAAPTAICSPNSSATRANGHPTPCAAIRPAISAMPTGSLAPAASRQTATQVLGDHEEGRVRHVVVKCLLVGMIMDRYVYAHEPTRSVPISTFEPAFARALQHAIDGPAPPRAPTG